MAGLYVEGCAHYQKKQHFNVHGQYVNSTNMPTD